MKYGFFSFGTLRVAIYLGLAAAFCGCDSKSETASSSTSSKAPAKPSTGSQQSPKPSFNAAQTKLLADSITRRDMGSDWGKIEMQPKGLLIHPGNSPTTAEFNIAGKFPKSSLNVWMVELPPNAASNPRAGTAKVTVFCDGKQVASAKVDRANNLKQPVSLSGVSNLKITVDNAGDGPFWDGVYVGLE